MIEAACFSASRAVGRSVDLSKSNNTSAARSIFISVLVSLTFRSLMLPARFLLLPPRSSILKTRSVGAGHTRSITLVMRFCEAPAAVCWATAGTSFTATSASTARHRATGENRIGASLARDGHVVHGHEMRNVDLDFLHAVGRGRELRIQAHAPLRRNVGHLAAAQTILVCIAYDLIFLLIGEVDQCDRIDISVAAVSQSTATHLEVTVGVVNERERQHQRVAADDLQLLDLNLHAGCFAVSGCQRRWRRGWCRRTLSGRAAGQAHHRDAQRQCEEKREPFSHLIPPLDEPLPTNSKTFLYSLPKEKATRAYRRGDRAHCGDVRKLSPKRAPHAAP